jgi:hypothetical protein
MKVETIVSPRGGKRAGAGRKKREIPKKTCHFALDDDIIRILDQVSERNRGNFIALCVRERWKKGFGETENPIEQAARLLGVEKSDLDMWLQDYRKSKQAN